jgi:hypothetical protein
MASMPGPGCCADWRSMSINQLSAHMAIPSSLSHKAAANQAKKNLKKTDTYLIVHAGWFAQLSGATVGNPDQTLPQRPAGDTSNWGYVKDCDVPTPVECISEGVPCQGPSVAPEVPLPWRPWPLMGAAHGPEARRRVRNAHLPRNFEASRWAGLHFDNPLVFVSSCGLWVAATK